jgi:hypothetical protein
MVELSINQLPGSKYNFFIPLPLQGFWELTFSSNNPYQMCLVLFFRDLVALKHCILQHTSMQVTWIISFQLVTTIEKAKHLTTSTQTNIHMSKKHCTSTWSTHPSS